MNTKMLPWFLAFSKRLFQKPFFLLIVCLFPVLSVVVSLYSQSDKPLIQVALYNEGNTQLSKDTIASLQELDSTILFYETDSVQQLQADVKKQKAECGYIFTENYTTENLLKNISRKKAVEVIKSPASILSGSINELIFASYFKTHNKELLLDYLQQPKVLKGVQNVDEVVSKAALYFDKYTQNENILQPDKTSMDNHTLTKEQLIADANEITRTFITDLCRGILSILMMLAALCGGLQLIQDRKSGLFAPLIPPQNLYMEFLDILTPVVYVAITGYIGLLILPAGQPPLKELAGLLLYIPAVVLCAYVLVRIAGMLYTPLIPLITLGSLVFTPVFIDLSAYAKILNIPKYFFINTYYLLFVKGSFGF